ncbi:MAG: hypothetical protein IPO08_20095 [Xanthomonadales bacterium]|nr:hypothetical protein [Xanthomonadales bacterium]
MKRALQLFLAVLLLPPLVAVSQTTVTRTLTWTAPVVDATHSAAAAYIVNWRPVGAASWTLVAPNPTTPTASIEIPTGVAVEARVQAVDSFGNIGPWSPLSDPYTQKVPSGCGKPSWL